MTALRQGARLRAAADFVRQDAVFADIGTDHAYLPLFLLSEGRIRHAVCADIAEGPLTAARLHAAGTPHLGKMEFVLTDGLDGLFDRGLTDIAICGMGGELIADILARAPLLRDGDVRLILQPMTRQELLRRTLSETDFSILREAYTVEAGRPYVTMCVHYTGLCRTLTHAEAVLGTPSAEGKDSAPYRAFLMQKERALSRAVDGLRTGGCPCEAECAMLEAVRAALAVQAE